MVLVAHGLIDRLRRRVCCTSVPGVAKVEVTPTTDVLVVVLPTVRSEGVAATVDLQMDRWLLVDLYGYLSFQPRRIKLLDSKNLDKTEKIYASYAEEFVLSVIMISNDDIYQKLNISSAEILLCTQGEARIEDGGGNHNLFLKRGDAAIVYADAGSYSIKGNTVLFKAAVPS